MGHPTVSLAELLGYFSGCFARPESFAVFQPVVAAWVLCLRCRTLTEVWQVTGLGTAMHGGAISLFASAHRDRDELGVNGFSTKEGMAVWKWKWWKCY